MRLRRVSKEGGSRGCILLITSLSSPGDRDTTYNVRANVLLLPNLISSQILCLQCAKHGARGFPPLTSLKPLKHDH